MSAIRLYHGTAHEFPEFTADFTLRGGEPNSALGIHLTESAANAAEYARLAAMDVHGGVPRVLIVEADISKVALVGSAADYLGRDPEIFDVETNRTRIEFVERRHELAAQGFDAVATSETELSEVDGCWAVFDPSRLKIIGTMPIEEAEELEEDIFFEGIEFEETTLFEDASDLVI